MKSILLSVCILFIYCLIACQSKPESGSTQNDTKDEDISLTGISADSVKMIKTAGIQCKVTDTRKATREIARIANSFQGILMKQDLENVSVDSKELNISDDSVVVITAYNPTAELLARIPSASLEDFLYEVNNLSNFTNNSRLDIEDKTLQYLASQLKQKARSGNLTNDTGRKSTGLTVTQKISIADQITEEEIGRKQINAEVNYSTVQLSLTQNPVIRKEIIANTSLSHYEIPFGCRLYTSLSEGMGVFLTFLLVIANLWAVILTIFIAWFLFKYFRILKRIRLSLLNSSKNG